jgi:hypothetical protein
MKACIPTLAAAAALVFGAQAQAHILAGNDAATASKPASSQSVLAVMKAAGIRYHAAANYKNEQRLTGSRFLFTSTGVRPDDRAGLRGV